ncbi:MAG: transposase [Hydrogenophaga sp.]|uniref:transposase n=1 Tax=Hydrogenophaga sp. TaxID=1904254 RepID=UPI00271B4BEB|nr:transposase [Hydrogenophaga sp.]MDO9147232.1 transposase [Hydrogenophaga sp.]MDO9604879.1 transposase [Hydrogenophaga sp.]MDP2163261.1 transposase [Hydrogenophaga sp.]MDP3476358.1 transposase [Hydrogenophaga sp.]
MDAPSPAALGARGAGQALGARIGASIKPLYGRQEGAALGYNPGKPGRPSHVLHTVWVGNLRLVLDVQVSSGKQHASVHAKAALGRLLDELGDGPAGRRPALVRGDSGYGNEGILLELESRGQPSLLRMRQTANVQRLVAMPFARQDWSRPDNQGGQTTARACALVYHGWSWYCRAAHPRARMEAITSRPLLLAAVGRAAHSGGQTTLYLTPMHGKSYLLKPLIANIPAALQHVKAVAEQFKTADPWAVLLRYVSDKLAPTLGPFRPPNGLPVAG